MSRTEIIAGLYKAFAECPRPEHFTNHLHCEECEEHDGSMRSATTLDALELRHLGHAGWSPLSFLTPEGLSHCLPRLIDLAFLEIEKDGTGEFYSSLLFQLVPMEGYNRFSNYSNVQRKAVLEALEFSNLHYRAKVAFYASEDDLDEAIRYWQRNAT